MREFSSEQFAATHAMVRFQEVENMFWALVLEKGKRYSQTVEQSFHISMAALEIPTDPDSVKGKPQTVSVMGATDKGEFLLCSLNTRGHFQQPLDLNFNEGEEVTFFINGEGTVHLTGYQIEDEPDFPQMDGEDDDDIEMDSDDDDDDEDVPVLVPGQKRKLKETPKVAKKKTKWLTPGGTEFSDDSDEDSDDDDIDDEDDKFMDNSDLLDMEAEEDDDDDDDDDEEEEESEEEAVPVMKTKTPKKEEKTPKKAEKSPKEKDKIKTPGKETQEKQDKQKTPAPSSESTPGPGGDAEQSSKKKKKKKKKKNKQVDSEATSNGTPAQPKQQQQTAADSSQSKTPNKPKATPKKQVLQGGTIMEEIHVGEGQVAKKGKMAHVYYVGKLQKDGRQFDSCTGGKPFRFRLGKGEVIKGWDAGVDGMKVGGKRRLTVPPQAGYGNQRAGAIPPNSTLVFEVELKNVS